MPFKYPKQMIGADHNKARVYWLRQMAMARKTPKHIRDGLDDCANVLDYHAFSEDYIGRMIRNLKKMPDTFAADGTPSPMNGRLWYRVSRLLDVSSTQAIRICQAVGEDPEWRSNGSEQMGRYCNVDPNKLPSARTYTE